MCRGREGCRNARRANKAIPYRSKERDDGFLGKLLVTKETHVLIVGWLVVVVVAALAVAAIDIDLLLDIYTSELL